MIHRFIPIQLEDALHDPSSLATFGRIRDPLRSREMPRRPKRPGHGGIDIFIGHGYIPRQPGHGGKKFFLLWLLTLVFGCNNTKKRETENQRTVFSAATAQTENSIQNASSAITGEVLPLNTSTPSSISTSTFDSAEIATQLFTDPTKIAPKNSEGTTGTIAFSVLTSKSPTSPTLPELATTLKSWDNRDDLIHIQSNISLSYVGLHLDNVRFTPTTDNLSLLEVQSANNDRQDWSKNFSRLLPHLTWSRYLDPHTLLSDFFSEKTISYMENGTFGLLLRSQVTAAGWNNITSTDAQTQINTLYTSELSRRCNAQSDETTWQSFYQPIRTTSWSQTVLADLRVKPLPISLEPLTGMLGSLTPTIQVPAGTYQALGFTVGMAWEKQNASVFCRSFVLMGTYSDGTITFPFLVESYSPLYGQISLPPEGIQITANQTQYAYLRMDPSNWFSQVDWSNVEIEMDGAKPLFVIFSEFGNADQFYKIKQAMANSFSYTGLSSTTNPFPFLSSPPPVSTPTDIAADTPTSNTPPPPLDPLAGYNFDSTESYYFPAGSHSTTPFQLSFIAPTATPTGLWVDYRKGNTLTYSDRRVSNFWLEKTTDGSGSAVLATRLDRWTSTLYLTQSNTGAFSFSSSTTPVHVRMYTKSTTDLTNRSQDEGFLKTDGGCILQLDPTVITTETVPGSTTPTKTQGVTCWTPNVTTAPPPFHIWPQKPQCQGTGNFYIYYMCNAILAGSVSTVFPEPSNCPQVSASCFSTGSKGGWNVFAVKNATTFPLLFSFSGGDSVWIAGGNTWKTTALSGYPISDSIAYNTGISLNEISSGYSLKTGFYGIKTSPIPLTISTNSNGAWNITSSVPGLIIVSP